MKRLLLISNSVSFGGGFLDHCMDEMVTFLGEIKEVLFVSYASLNSKKYTLLAVDRFKKAGIQIKGIEEGNPKENLQKAQAVFVGGGNTFRLIHKLQKEDLLGDLRSIVAGGVPYIGVSAGVNIASPTIKTTNDMPIIEPMGFDGLNLIGFQINPHYVEPDTSSTHMGETRQQRILEFLEENDVPVVGLKEGAWLNIQDEEVLLGGRNGAKVFMRNTSPREFKPGEQLVF